MQAWPRSAGLAAEALAEQYEAFVEHNAAFKQLATDWQLRGGEPNDHTDAAYDAALLVRVEELHAAFAPVAERIVTIAPRLAPYPGRLAAALERVRASDHRFLLSPMLDSYHQVWFELHEELILVGGLDRQEEAAAGRAQ